MRRAFGDAMISLCAVLLLLLLLVTIDPHVRDELSRVWNPRTASVATISSQARKVSTVVMIAAADHSIDSAPLLIFVLVGTVLFVFMLRT